LPDGNLQLIPAFALELVRTFLNIDYTFDFATADFLTIGSPDGVRLQLPYPELLINFYGNYEAFPFLSYADVVQKRFDPHKVKGKIVIIGSSLATQKDFFSTPFTRFTDLSKQYRDKFGAIISGVLGAKEIGVACHAHAVETILNKSFVHQVPARQVIWLTIFVGILGVVFYLPNLGFVWEMLGLVVGLSAVLGGGHLCFVFRQTWIDIAPFLCVLVFQFVAGVILQKAFDRKKTALVTGLFGQYVSPGVVEELLKGDISTSLEGRRQELTILFSDLRSFTSLAETLGAKSTSDLLNVYFDAMIPIVFKNKGTLDKLIGDAIMAFFGAPVAVTNHPDWAAQAALQMIAKIDELKRSKINGCERLEAGIGLNTGSVTVGNLGSSAFMDYTIIGDAVNLASRLEGLNKIYGTHILVSEFTAQRLDQKFLLRELDLVQVKGKGEAVALFELIGWKADQPARMAAGAGIFEQGVHAYRQRKWVAARRLFAETLALVPGDGPASLYLQRIQQMQAIPPGDDWNGVTVFDHK
jgi:adenylate cyclase